MNILEMLPGPLLSAGLAFVGAAVGVKVAVARLEERHTALDQREAEHHADHGRRISSLEGSTFRR